MWAECTKFLSQLDNETQTVPGKALQGSNSESPGSRAGRSLQPSITETTKSKEGYFTEEVKEGVATLRNELAMNSTRTSKEN